MHVKRKKRGEIQQKKMSTEGGVHLHSHTCTPMHFQTLIYNFNISNFHSGAHFQNVIFQFMSNRVTIFLNTAYDKLGGTEDMQFRLSVLQAQQQTHTPVCVFVFISVCSVFWRGPTGTQHTRENWLFCQIWTSGVQNHNSVINPIIIVIIRRITMVAMIMY